MMIVPCTDQTSQTGNYFVTAISCFPTEQTVKAMALGQVRLPDIPSLFIKALAVLLLLWVLAWSCAEILTFVPIRICTKFNSSLSSNPYWNVAWGTRTGNHIFRPWVQCLWLDWPGSRWKLAFLHFMLCLLCSNNSCLQLPRIGL